MSVVYLVRSTNTLGLSSSLILLPLPHHYVNGMCSTKDPQLNFLLVMPIFKPEQKALVSLNITHNENIEVSLDWHF
jgi:hypothetical protein